MLKNNLIFAFFLIATCIAFSTKAQQKKLSETDYYLPRQISQLYIKQDLFYKGKSKEVLRKNVAVTISIPADLRPSGLSKYVGTFKYEELASILKQDKRAVWVNPFNPLMRFSTKQALDYSWYESVIYQYQQPVTDEKMYVDNRDSVRLEKEWDDFELIYQNQGNLFSEVRSWQKLDSTRIFEKPKRLPKINKKAKWLSSIWLRVEFSSPLNIGFNGENREFSRIVIDAVLSGKLIAYKSDKFEKKLSVEEFKENITYPTAKSDNDYNQY
ncbi:MAG: hypothetical protein ACI85I_000756 [Arenicella sp.]|jgi:hypothetical protein